MNLLQIHFSINGANSVSRQLSAAIVAEWRRTLPNLHIVRRDLDLDPVPALRSGTQRAVARPNEAAEAEAASAAQARALEEFLLADIIVIGAPMYNLGIAGPLKAWIDSLAVPGKTFAYSPTGPRGLAGGKTVMIASSRGNFYGGEQAVIDFQEPYLRAILGFFGITDLEIVRAEGVAISAVHREEAMDRALATVTGAVQHAHETMALAAEA